MSSNMEERNCYNTCPICSPRYGIVPEDFKDALIVHIYKRK